MSTAIAVTNPGLALPPPDRHTPAAHVLTPPDRQPLDSALTELHRLVEQHGYVVTVYPTGTPLPVVQRMHMVRSLLESDRIALLEMDLPPLATAILIRQLRQLSVYDFSPGVLASAARLLAHYVYAGALLNSVAKLDRVPVGLTSHAKSWVPGAQFGVLANPRPQLVKVGGSAKLAGPEFATHLLVAQGQLTSDWVRSTLATQWPVQAVQEAELPADSARWWGTGKLVEFAAAIPDVATLYQLVNSVQVRQCRWCGLELIGDRCAFCAAPTPPPENQPVAGGVVHHVAPVTGRSWD
ncbi:hypothetical protein E0L36_10520 [Streptomyces sp. AJS327]|uniref:hypothetical protein n=1 Tax=Streptomyces sp. AJS327 TaxID=2545265 RepID=UPI0015DF9C4F|nr:hypothetical protein [Streptomyces sp. AJS327]MBA0051308.1 hypothetical protein [Streptomyces sp. AJS327]